MMPPTNLCQTSIFQHFHFHKSIALRKSLLFLFQCLLVSKIYDNCSPHVKEMGNQSHGIYVTKILQKKKKHMETNEIFIEKNELISIRI